MARNYHDAWGNSSWKQWSWEEAAQKFESTMGDLEKKCDWLRGVLDDQRDEMKRLDKEVARLGQENKDLRQRVLELEGVHASQLERIARLEQRQLDRNAVANAAGVAMAAAL